MKRHPNEQSYNIISHSNASEDNQRNQYTRAGVNEAVQRNASQINVMDGYPQKNVAGGKGKESQFISSLVYQRDQERQNQPKSVNNHNQRTIER